MNVRRLKKQQFLSILVLISILYWIFLEIAYIQKWDNVLLGVLLEIISIPILILPLVIFPLTFYKSIRDKQKRASWILPMLLSMAAIFLIVKDFF